MHRPRYEYAVKTQLIIFFEQRIKNRFFLCSFFGFSPVSSVRDAALAKARRAAARCGRAPHHGGYGCPPASRAKEPGSSGVSAAIVRARYYAQVDAVREATFANRLECAYRSSRCSSFSGSWLSKIQVLSCVNRTRANGNSDINKAAQQTADQLAPGIHALLLGVFVFAEIVLSFTNDGAGQGELSRSHEAAFAQGVRDTVGGAAQGGGAQHTPPALPPMPVVHRTTWDEAAPSPGVVQPSAEGQSAEERPAASAADGLANDLRDLQNVADKLGDGKVDAKPCCY